MRLQLKGSVAGRFMWQLGTKTVNQLGLFSLQNCFGKETEFLTSEGIKSFEQFEDGDEILIRGRNSWVPATVRNYGEQQLFTIIFNKGKRVETLRATANHRWILEDNSIVTTEELEPGQEVRMFQKRTNFHNLQMCPIAIQHGIVFGDGNWNENAKACAITICGDSVDEIKSFFVGQDVSKKEVSGLPWNWQNFPELGEVNKHYLYGFLAGWFAADGAIASNGSNITLASSNKNHLQWARGAFAKLDITTSEIKLSRELSPFDGTEKPLYRITIDRENLPKEFFLLSKHNNRFKPLELFRKWKVSDIHYSSDVDEVWCVHEPNNEEFTLANGILTKNCAFTVVDDPIRPFTWTMDALMLGSGVGYNIQREYVYELPKPKRVRITRLDTNDADFIVPDSREGWVELLKKTLEAHFHTGSGFSYSTICIRGKGTPIKGFGGLASGPEELCWGIGEINKLLNGRAGKKVRPIDALDIMNIIGAIVVAGNVRRSAQIAIGDYDDIQFLKAKRWDLGNIPSWRAMSNNSVVCNDIRDLLEIPQFWEGYMGNGEPYGLINLNLAQSIGRVGEAADARELLVRGFNPCAEQSLADKETCCLAELYLPNITSYEEFMKCAKMLYRINKHSLALKCHHPETQEIVHANMRMGIGVTGYLMATDEQKGWLSEAYKELKEYDKEYSAEHNLPTSVKLTTVKPSGTLSLLAGVTPGAHPGYSHFHIRRVRMASNIPLVDECRRLGYPIEYVRKFDGSEDHGTVVVSFPASFPKHTRVAADMTAIDQLEVIKELQTNWSDNAVSVTIYYKKEELREIQNWLSKNYNTNLKTVSFLLHSEHGFDQAPLEEITEEQYNEMIASIQEAKLEGDIEEMDGCENGHCPIK